MSMATRQVGGLLSILSLCSAFVLGAAGNAGAQPVIPVAPGQVKLTFEGLGGERGGGSALNLSLVKIGPIQSSKGAVLGDGSVCPHAGKLTPSGVTFVCAHDASLLEWYKGVLAGKTDRKSGSIILQDREGNEVLRTYNLFECWPVSISRYEGGDCDDTDADVEPMEVTLALKAIQIVPKSSISTKSIKQGHYAVSNFNIEIDGVSGGYLSNSVSGLELKSDAACLAKGAQTSQLGCSTGFSLATGADDDCDGLFEMVLQGQAKASPPSTMKATINTSRSNIKNNRTVALPPTVLTMEGARIESVTLPTFQVVAKPPVDGPSALEYLEIRVDRIEMK